MSAASGLGMTFPRGPQGCSLGEDWGTNICEPSLHLSELTEALQSPSHFPSGRGT